MYLWNIILSQIFPKFSKDKYNLIDRRVLEWFLIFLHRLLPSLRSFQFQRVFLKNFRRRGKSRDKVFTPLEKSINLTIYGWKENKPERKERGICLTASTVGERRGRKMFLRFQNLNPANQGVRKTCLYRFVIRYFRGGFACETWFPKCSFLPF